MADHDQAVIVKDLYKSFRLPYEQHSGIKSWIVNFYKQKRGYEVQEVLKDISFEIEEGDFFGIVGRNGSGKSTLLKLLAGIYVPDKGLVQVNGNLTPFIELGVGFNPELTGRENIFLNGALLGFDRKQMADMYDDIVGFAELDKFMDQKLKNYSSGMQVRLAFSIAIRAKSDILLLDEVLAVGDQAFQQKCFDYFEKLKEEKKTVIFVSHDMGAIRRFCNKAIYLKKGRIIFEGSPIEVADIYAEENIKTTLDNKVTGPAAPEQNKMTAKISKETADEIEFEIEYESNQKDAVYVGISIIKDGISIAEIITPSDKPLLGKGKVTYRLDTNILNAGVYGLTGALFRLKNRELIAFTKTRKDFVVKGADPTRGGAIKLGSNWKYSESAKNG